MQENQVEIPQVISVKVEKIEYSIVPGSITEIPLRLINRGEKPDYLELNIMGIPTSWAIFSEQVVQLAPNEERDVLLTIQPPPPPQTQAGIYSVQVTVTSQSDPEIMAAIDLSIRVAVLEVRGRIGVMMDSVQFSVSPGNSIDVPVLLLNQGLEPDSFRLSVEGVPVNWISTQTPTTQLEPGQEKQIELMIKPPRASSSKAGRHAFTLRFTSQSIPQDYIDVGCILTIAAYVEYRVGLKPAQVRAGTPVQLMVENKGNIDETFDLSWQSYRNDLIFEGILPVESEQTTQSVPKTDPQTVPLNEPYPLRVPYGQIGFLDFRARPVNQAIIGGEKVHEYSVAARSVEMPEAEALTVQGKVTSLAWIPIWVLPVLLTLCLGFTCLFAYLSNRSRNQTANATQTVEYSTAVALAAVAATQTSSANQTAAVLEGQLDTDGDGLRDNEEKQLATDPNNADSDGDELGDWQEVYEYLTNPLNSDSDADELSDGEEVLRQTTNPLNTDTDADGLSDGDEVRRETNPLKPDTDSDGLGDGDEVQGGTNPLRPDTDNDQLLDGQETPPCPSPLDPDSDKDSFIDGKDPNPCDPNNPSLTATALAGRPLTATPTFIIPTASPTVPPTASPTVPPTALPTATSATNTTPAPSLSSAIAFQSNRDGNLEIYVQNTADNSVTRLTNDPAADIQPAWSPDGSQIAFTSNRSGNNEIYLMNANGSNLVNLTNNPSDDQYPSWSPDGLRIVFSSNREGNWEIYSVLLNGTLLVNLTNHDADDLYPDWFVNGAFLNRQELITFTTNRDGNYEVYTMHVDGTEQTNITNNAAEDFYPAASNNGERIAFVSDRDGSRDVFVMGSHGESPVNLTTNSADDLFPKWSPDDQWLAFATHSGNSEIFVIRLDSSNMTNFTNHPSTDNYPAWR